MTRETMENADYPDDIQLKMEIDEISNRIDRIIETVRERFPVNTEKTEGNGANDDADRQGQS